MAILTHVMSPPDGRPSASARPSQPEARVQRADEAPEQALANAVAAGDLTALGQLYDLHQAATLVFARRLVGEGGAEDLVHDTFLALPKALQRYQHKSKLRTFILGVAVNQARHRLRSRSRFAQLLSRFAHEPHESQARLHHQSPEQDSEQRQLSAMLERALQSLSFEHRTAFVLCEIEERTSPEVAELLGIPEATVRTRLYHAKRKLRAQLARENTNG